MRGVSNGGAAESKGSFPGSIRTLRTFAAAAGIGSAILFVFVGVCFRFQLFGDASLFSYAIAVQDSWAFHWHNISSRSTVYLYAHVPAELYGRITGDASGAIRIYGILFYGVQLIGLALTWLFDRSAERTVFIFACASTAAICPLIFGSPSEMWVAHALFWPALAAAHSTGPRWNAVAAFATFLPLSFAHEGALVFIAAILATILLRDGERRRFLHGLGAAAAVLCIWIFVRITFVPDDYTGKVLASAAMNVFDPAILANRMLVLLAATAGGFMTLFLVLRSANMRHAPETSAAAALAALVLYWLFGDPALHASDRYYLRTALIVLTPALGVVAVCAAYEGRLIRLAEKIYGVARGLFVNVGVRGVAVALLLVLLIHGAETARFAAAWDDHLVMFKKIVTEPQPQSPGIVNIDPERPEFEELPWFSTLPYLSVLVAPGFRPARLAVDPKSDYFWISCATATASVRKAGPHGIPAQSRAMIRDLNCKHRP